MSQVATTQHIEVAVGFGRSAEIVRPYAPPARSNSRLDDRRITAPDDFRFARSAAAWTGPSDAELAIAGRQEQHGSSGGGLSFEMNEHRLRHSGQQGSVADGITNSAWPEMYALPSRAVPGLAHGFGGPSQSSGGSPR
jgi:hypothetical protein